MKKLFALLLAAAMILSMAACGSGTSSGNNATTPNETNGEAVATDGTANDPAALNLSGKKLVIGTQAKAAGLYVYVAQELGLFEDAGLDVEIVTFASGAPINEAMAAGELDVAVSGMATVYALATGMYTYIGDGTITVNGQAIYARADSDIAKAGVYSGNIIGSAETVKGCSILGPLSTAAHYNAISYVKAFDLTSDDFSMVSMEYAQAYEAFITGQGDLLATTPPYTSQLAADPNYVKVADLYDVMGAPLVDTISVQNEVAETRGDDLVALLDCLYTAMDILATDDTLRAEYGMRIYASEGTTYTEDDMASEIANQSYFTWDMLREDVYEFGATMINIGAFFVDQGMIEADDYPNIEASMDHSFIERAIAYHDAKNAE